MKPVQQKGFTLIEILIVLGIFIIIGALSVFISFDFYRSYSFRSEEDTLVSILQKARSQAINNIDQVNHGVHLDSSNYTVFQGSSYVPGASTNVDFPVSKGFTPFVAGGIIVFTQLSGTTTPASITLTDTNTNKITTITINNEGQINY